MCTTRIFDKRHLLAFGLFVITGGVEYLLYQLLPRLTPQLPNPPSMIADQVPLAALAPLAVLFIAIWMLWLIYHQEPKA